MSSDEERIAEALQRSVIDTFADMAFLDVIPEPHYEGDVGYTAIMGVSFSSPAAGRIFFYLTRECKKRLVENIYGENWGKLNDMEIDDCLLEILNVLAGGFLKNLYGMDCKINMSFPRIYFDDDTIPGGVGKRRFIFNAEGAMFKTVLDIEI